jgi:hypothetical protein
MDEGIINSIIDMGLWLHTHRYCVAKRCVGPWIWAHLALADAFQDEKDSYLKIHRAN